MSNDGYVRVSLDELKKLPFMHLYSEINAEFQKELITQTVQARLAGFTEWKSKSYPSISAGWGWFIDSKTNQMLLAPEDVRSNIMLIDRQGYDLGPTKTNSLLGNWLNDFSWQESVKQTI